MYCQKLLAKNRNTTHNALRTYGICRLGSHQITSDSTPFHFSRPPCKYVKTESASQRSSLLNDIIKTEFLQSCVCMFYMCPTLVVTADESNLGPSSVSTASAIGPMLAWGPFRRSRWGSPWSETPETVLNLHCNASKQNCTMQSKVQ